MNTKKKGKNEKQEFIIALFLLSVVFALIVVFYDNFKTSIIYTIGIPLYTFGIWLMIFMGNRRVESRKLGESFKHKFVMAKSFVGYKNSILEMPLVKILVNFLILKVKVILWLV